MISFFLFFFLSPGGGWYAYAFSGRLYLEDNHANKYIGAWCAQPRSKNQFLEINLSALKTITAVATQGIHSDFRF